MRLSTTITAFVAMAAAASAQQIAQIVDSSNFCIFLPPVGSADVNIADTETYATVRCVGDAPKATGAGTLPSGFILSAHYVSTSAYVQITGQIDPSKAGLNVTDDGGQYDVKAPDGSSCAGWQYYVNLIEPSGNDYCIRCCNDTVNCNRGISQAGCARVVPGDYSGPGVSTTASSSSVASSSSTVSSSASSSTPVKAAATASSKAATTHTAEPSSASALPTDAVSAQSESGAVGMIKPALASVAVMAAACAFNLF
ncbi:hypothetical protein K450DRAFT_221725 [Umbelopsis ramanniana AG]|uniref:Uncharacterized protein n=1 Tax=Umbelopsis ramanniana AG TaxID=1314678 RepID=A0AAD5HGK1_UMBRA|nr:uncharacterized protein K450DRAFT_221725 [Umbelopsis ramanniana AG]KAI8583560.1 hypothetical protein K450DRAFT_221725 [Umbelopsis ramanniana AG]